MSQLRSPRMSILDLVNGARVLLMHIRKKLMLKEDDSIHCQ